MNRGLYGGVTSLVTPPAHTHRPVVTRMPVPLRVAPGRGLLSSFNPPVDLSEWVPWYPVVTQLGVVAATINEARYMQQGKEVVAEWDVVVTGTGTTANAITVSLPIPPFFQPTGVGRHIGVMFIYRLSATTRYNGNAELQGNTGTVGLSYDQASASLVGVAPAFALAAGDLLRGTAVYEAA